jgi:uncharacterized membrane protein
MRRTKALVRLFLVLAAASGALLVWSAQRMYFIFNGASVNGWALNMRIVDMLWLRLLIGVIGLLIAGVGILVAWLRGQHSRQ